MESTRLILDKIHQLKVESIDTQFESGILLFKFPGDISHLLSDNILENGKTAEIQGVDNNELSIFLYELPGIFYDIKDFRSRINLTTFKTNIGIIFHTDSTYLFFEVENQRTISVPPSEDVDSIIEQTFYYLKFQDKFIRNFSDNKIFIYHDPLINKIIILSPEHGLIDLRYPSEAPEFENSLELNNCLDTLNTISSKKEEFFIYLKNHLYKALNSVKVENRFIELVINFPNIVSATQKDYDIYLSEFSFDTFNENFRKERSEYFASIRDIVNKIIGKIISIPISISATVLALNEVQNEPIFSNLVVVAYVVYGLITSFLIHLLTHDVYDLKVQLGIDISLLTSKIKSEKDLIILEAKRVIKRLLYLIITISLIQLLLLFLSVLVLYLMYSRLENIQFSYFTILSFIIFAHLSISAVPIIKFLFHKNL